MLVCTYTPFIFDVHACWPNEGCRLRPKVAIPPVTWRAILVTCLSDLPRAMIAVGIYECMKVA